MNIDTKEFEEKLRIQKKIEKEFRDNEIYEWSDACIKAMVLAIIVSFLLKACAN